MSEAPAGASFGELLAEYRRAAQLTRAALARRAEISPRSIDYLESGAHQPYADTIHRLATALGLSASDRARLEQAGRPTARRSRAASQAAATPDSAGIVPDAKPVLPHNLPAPLTSFIGREREQAELHAVLESARLVTLTGPGGIGKTRLALEVAASRVGEYPDGIWLVELAGVSDARLVPEAVGGVLVRHEQGRRSAPDWLAAALRSRRLLLVLDNCEHLVEACAVLAEQLLRACPALQVLATSRERLGVAGEHVWQVPPLHVPTDQPSLARLRHEPSVQLFAERARAASARFRLSAENAGAVVQICRRLDGLPLAIELAAGRAGLLTVQEIVARLDDRFRLLACGSRTAPVRHQTLRTLVAWSYDLASEPSKRLFERLAPFAGGWTLDAAERVCAGGTGDEGREGSGTGSPSSLVPGPAALDVLELLGSLVNQSLVHTEDEGGVTRYRLLETLREFAAERLAERGETAPIHRRHAEHYLALAEAADLGLRGPDQAQWAARLAREHDNLQAALRWSTAQGEAELAHRLVGALWTYWYTRPRGVEGARWYDRVLALSDERVPPAIRAKALTGATGQALLEGDRGRAQQRCQASLALLQTLGDSQDHAHTLLLAALLAAVGGEPEVARSRFQDSLEMCRRLGARRGEGWVLGLLGQMATFAGDYERASALLAASAQMLREVGDAFGLAGSLMRAGDAAGCQGDRQRARAYYLESMAQFRAAGLPLGPPTLLHNLACVLRDQGESEWAATLFEDGLGLYVDRGDLAGAAHCLLGLADLARDGGEPRLAARLLGAVERLPRGRPLGLLGGWVWIVEGKSHEQQVARARADLGDAVFEAAFAEGQALTLDLAVAEARYARDAGQDQNHVTGAAAQSVAFEGLAGTVLDLETRRARRTPEHPSGSAASQV